MGVELDETERNEMKTNIRQATFPVVLLLLCAGIGLAQETPPSPAHQVSKKDLATVYVYRYDYDPVAFWFLTKTLPVYFGEGASAVQKLRKIAGLRKKRYFVMRLSPGAYTFDTKGMYGKLKLDVAAGKEYYLRFDQGYDCWDDSEDVTGHRVCEDRNPAIRIEHPLQGQYELSKVKPIKPNNVQDSKLVIIPPATPANNSFNQTPP